MITVRPHTLVLTGGESYLLPKLSEYKSNISLSSRSPGDVPPPNVGMMPSFDEILHKSNLIPFGEVRVDNHPPTPPVPMTLPMVYLVPVSKDEVSWIIKYLTDKNFTILFPTGFRRGQIQNAASEDGSRPPWGPVPSVLPPCSPRP